MTRAEPQRRTRTPAPRRRRRSTLERAWPWVLRFAGLSIGLWETVVARFDRPSVMMFALVLLGFDRFVAFERRGDDEGR